MLGPASQLVASRSQHAACPVPLPSHSTRGVNSTAAHNSEMPCPCLAPCSGRQVALDIAEALHFMHTRMQIVHSDLKAA